MYLSKLILDIRSREVRKALGNCQDMHRDLQTAFAGNREEAGVLYRLEEKKQSIELYVLSKEKPDWKVLEERGCIINEKVLDISSLRELYKENAVLRFELLAFPAKKVKGDGKNSRRIFLKECGERRDWIFRQADKYGFQLLEVYEDDAWRQIVGKKEGRIVYSAVNFYGCLQIGDSKKFWDSYEKGIGAGKAYGLGMLMLSKM